MNIFILDENPQQNVQSYVDRHVVKMILEHAQMLSTAVRESGIDAGYKSTHKNHPCTKWVRESLSNWLYLRDLTEALHDEWQYRYNHSRIHKSAYVVRSLPIPEIPDIGITPFAQAMPDEFKHPDSIIAYRNYYRHNKQHLFHWTKRSKPTWIK